MNSYDERKLMNLIEESPSDEKIEEFLEKNLNAKKLYDSINKIADNYLVFYNINDGYIYYPNSFQEKFALENRYYEDATKSLKSIIHSDDYRKLISAMTSFIDGSHDKSETLNLNIRLRDASEEFSWCNIKADIIHDDTKSPSVVSILIQTATNKNYFDYLTELPNRFYLADIVKKDLKEDPRREFAIINLDIDDFRKINEHFDRTFGDLVLWRIGNTLQDVLNQYNLQLCRIDGDTFAVYIKTSDREMIQKIFDELVNSGIKSIVIEKKKINLSLCGGCTIYPKDGKTYAVLQNYAEYTLKSAKQCGKNMLKFFDENLYFQNHRYHELSDIIEDCIEDNFRGFDVNFQPHITSATGRLVGAEALARFTCDEYGRVSPVEFVEIIERMGMIIPFGKWILSKSMIACKDFQKLVPDFHMNVNVSFNQLRGNEFLLYLQDELKKLNFNSKDLVLEITENTLANNTEKLKQKFREISSMGVRVAIDDFGTGYSSLGILKEVKFDVLKIDKVFVKDITKDDFYLSFIEMLSRICEKLNVMTCLEGVETKEEFDIIKNNASIDIIQGYYFGKPQSYDEFIKYILEKEVEMNKVLQGR